MPRFHGFWQRTQNYQVREKEQQFITHSNSQVIVFLCLFPRLQFPQSNTVGTFENSEVEGTFILTFT